MPLNASVCQAGSSIKSWVPDQPVTDSRQLFLCAYPKLSTTATTASPTSVTRSCAATTSTGWTSPPPTSVGAFELLQESLEELASLGMLPGAEPGGGEVAMLALIEALIRYLQQDTVAVRRY